MALRNILYWIGFFSSKKYNLPIISVGNLSVGGTGKTPQIEYLVRLLSRQYKIAILSRGYKRNTKGFIEVLKSHSSLEVGDEPLQYKHKFSNITIAVHTNRVKGIDALLRMQNPPEVILLDDAFQHRRVKPGLSILLTDFHQLYCKDYMLPSGTLREFKSGSKRADLIIITKTPAVYSPIVYRNLLEELKPKNYQKVYCSFIRYKPMVALADETLNVSEEGLGVVLVTGIVNSAPLKEYLERKASRLIHLEYNDHHHFTDEDLEHIIKTYNDFYSGNKIIVTTEKDVMRIINLKRLDDLLKLPVFYAPIEFDIHKDFKEEFDQTILNYVQQYYRSN